jgi:hypothetical protein
MTFSAAPNVVAVVWLLLRRQLGSAGLVYRQRTMGWVSGGAFSSERPR